MQSRSKDFKKQMIEIPKIGRNQPCPCGAVKPDGKPIKFKNCHWKLFQTENHGIQFVR